MTPAIRQRSLSGGPMIISTQMETVRGFLLSQELAMPLRATNGDDNFVGRTRATTRVAPTLEGLFSQQ